MCGSGAQVLEPGWGLLPLLVIVPGYLWLHRGRLVERRTWLVLAAVVYLAVLLSLTFMPLPLPPYEIEPGCPYLYTRPFGTIGPALQSGFASPEGRFLIGNVLAFVPAGILLPLLRGDRRPWLAALAGGFALSVAIELGQLAASLVIGYPYRQADVDDVIVNTVGAGVGYLLLAGGQLFRRRGG